MFGAENSIAGKLTMDLELGGKSETATRASSVGTTLPTPNLTLSERRATTTPEVMTHKKFLAMVFDNAEASIDCSAQSTDIVSNFSTNTQELSLSERDSGVGSMGRLLDSSSRHRLSTQRKTRYRQPDNMSWTTARGAHTSSRMTFSIDSTTTARVALARRRRSGIRRDTSL